jgi:hypothetical protein
MHHIHLFLKSAPKGRASEYFHLTGSTALSIDDGSAGDSTQMFFCPLKLATFNARSLDSFQDR